MKITLRSGLTFELRSATGADMNYVHSATALSYKHGARDAGEVLTRADRERHIRARMDAVFDVILVAVPPESPNIVLGFAWGAPPRNPDDSAVLHYVYVNELYRKQGVALALIAAVCKQPHRFLCTTWTRDFAAFAHQHQSLYWRIT